VSGFEAAAIIAAIGGTVAQSLSVGSGGQAVKPIGGDMTDRMAEFARENIEDQINLSRKSTNRPVVFPGMDERTKNFLQTSGPANIAGLPTGTVGVRPGVSNFVRRRTYGLNLPPREALAESTPWTDDWPAYRGLGDPSPPPPRLGDPSPRLGDSTIPLNDMRRDQPSQRADGNSLIAGLLDPNQPLQQRVGPEESSQARVKAAIQALLEERSSRGEFS
jgi:hypothetical protein